jgi:prephenate dehydrogenase
MGGSLGLALRARQPGVVVRGFDRDPGVARRAQDRGAIHAVTATAREAVEGADLVFTAVPPGAALDLVPALLPRLGEGAALADMSSVMLPLRACVDAAAGAAARRFVASHPLSGSERDGIEAARDDLFRDRTVLIGASTEPGSPGAAVEALWIGLGAKPLAVDPAGHDALLALTSHLPLLASAALLRAVRGSGRAPSAVAPVAGPGFRDTSRVGASAPELWTQILGLNATNLGPALERLEQEVAALRRALAEDPARLAVLLAEARAFRREILG